MSIFIVAGGLFAMRQAPAPVQLADVRKGCEPIKGTPIDFTTKVTDSAKDVERPVQLRTVQPLLPEEFVSARTGGMVAVKVLISQTGCVEDVTIIKATHKLLEAPVIAAVKQWRYTPARRPDGAAVPVVIMAAVSASHEP